MDHPHILPVSLIGATMAQAHAERYPDSDLGCSEEWETTSGLLLQGSFPGTKRLRSPSLVHPCRNGEQGERNFSFLFPVLGGTIATILWLSSPVWLFYGSSALNATHITWKNLHTLWLVLLMALLRSAQSYPFLSPHMPCLWKCKGPFALYWATWEKAARHPGFAWLRLQLSSVFTFFLVRENRGISTIPVVNIKHLKEPVGLTWYLSNREGLQIMLNANEFPIPFSTQHSPTERKR